MPQRQSAVDTQEVRKDMKKGIIARKVGMTQVFTETGNMVPVTVLEAGPCVVTQKKTVENDGYSAIQVGFVDKKSQPC